MISSLRDSAAATLPDTGASTRWAPTPASWRRASVVCSTPDRAHVDDDVSRRQAGDQPVVTAEQGEQRRAVGQHRDDHRATLAQRRVARRRLWHPSRRRTHRRPTRSGCTRSAGTRRRSAGGPSAGPCGRARRTRRSVRGHAHWSTISRDCEASRAPARGASWPETRACCVAGERNSTSLMADTRYGAGEGRRCGGRGAA